MVIHLSFFCSSPGLLGSPSLPVAIGCPSKGNPWIMVGNLEHNVMPNPLPCAHFHFLGDRLCSYSNVQLNVRDNILPNDVENSA